MTDAVGDKPLYEAFIQPVMSAQDMRNWILTYLDLDLPDHHIDPDSNSSMLEAMYEAYAAYRDDTVLQTPGYIWLSSRDSGKTLGGAILNVMLMIHFKAQVCHFAANKGQSEKCLSYVNWAFRKLSRYLEYHGRRMLTDSKYKIEIVNEDESVSSIEVIVATVAGSNSAHAPVVSYDELDTLSGQKIAAYEEAKSIPTRYKGRGPLRIKYSTRKYAFGVFEKEIAQAPQTGEKVLRWNYIDITEACPPSRHLPEEPKVVRYVAGQMPLANISEEQFNSLSVDAQKKYERVEGYSGCAKCPLLQVCRTRLAHRPQDARGGLYKTIDQTINTLKQFSPDMAEAQYLCLKPSAAGLIYKRFSESSNGGNVLELEQAWHAFVGDALPPDLSFDLLLSKMVQAGVRFKATVDWGFRHFWVLLVFAEMPNGDVWIVDCHALSELELDDQVRITKRESEKLKDLTVYPDSAYPASIKTFRRNKIRVVEFVKDVQGGIDAVRTLIVDGSGRRRLKVVKHDRTQVVIDMFKVHHFKLDPSGRPTTEPDDEEYADIGDCVRYMGQNVRIKKPSEALSPVRSGPTPEQLTAGYNEAFAKKLDELTGGQTVSRAKVGFGIWDFGSADTPEPSEYPSELDLLKKLQAERSGDDEK